mmetsp:Transcript_6624/g.27521  ORF Transcript_6624/g.27521 Transcript_6624/m.27521 type:complete len:358 (+) Transcript_6624:1556-2629(+)
MLLPSHRRLTTFLLWHRADNVITLTASKLALKLVRQRHPRAVRRLSHQHERRALVPLGYPNVFAQVRRVEPSLRLVAEDPKRHRIRQSNGTEGQRPERRRPDLEVRQVEGEVYAARGVRRVDARGGAEPEVSAFAKLHHLVHPVVCPRRRSEADGLLDGERLERGDGALDRGRASPDPLRHLPPVVVAEDGREEPLDARRGAVDARAQRVANVEIALARVEEAPRPGDLLARRGSLHAPGEFQRGHGVGDGALVRGGRGSPAGLGDGLEAREEQRLGARRRRGRIGRFGRRRRRHRAVSHRPVTRRHGTGDAPARWTRCHRRDVRSEGRHDGGKRRARASLWITWSSDEGARQCVES